MTSYSLFLCYNLYVKLACVCCCCWWWLDTSVLRCRVQLYYDWKIK